MSDQILSPAASSPSIVADNSNNDAPSPTEKDPTSAPVAGGEYDGHAKYMSRMNVPIIYELERELNHEPFEEKSVRIVLETMVSKVRLEYMRRLPKVLDTDRFKIVKNNQLDNGNIAGRSYRKKMTKLENKEEEEEEEEEEDTTNGNVLNKEAELSIDTDPSALSDDDRINFFTYNEEEDSEKYRVSSTVGSYFAPMLEDVIVILLNAKALQAPKRPNVLSYLVQFAFNNTMKHELFAAILRITTGPLCEEYHVGLRDELYKQACIIYSNQFPRARMAYDYSLNAQEISNKTGPGVKNHIQSIQGAAHNSITNVLTIYEEHPSLRHHIRYVQPHISGLGFTDFKKLKGGNNRLSYYLSSFATIIDNVDSGIHPDSRRTLVDGQYPNTNRSRAYIAAKGMVYLSKPSAVVRYIECLLPGDKYEAVSPGTNIRQALQTYLQRYNNTFASAMEGINDFLRRNDVHSKRGVFYIRAMLHLIMLQCHADLQHDKRIHVKHVEWLRKFFPPSNYTLEALCADKDSMTIIEEVFNDFSNTLMVLSLYPRDVRRQALLKETTTSIESDFNAILWLIYMLARDRSYRELMTILPKKGCITVGTVLLARYLHTPNDMDQIFHMRELLDPANITMAQDVAWSLERNVFVKQLQFIMSNAKLYRFFNDLHLSKLFNEIWVHYHWLRFALHPWRPGVFVNICLAHGKSSGDIVRLVLGSQWPRTLGTVLDLVETENLIGMPTEELLVVYYKTCIKHLRSHRRDDIRHAIIHGYAPDSWMTPFGSGYEAIYYYMYSYGSFEYFTDADYFEAVRTSPSKLVHPFFKSKLRFEYTTGRLGELTAIITNDETVTDQASKDDVIYQLHAATNRLKENDNWTHWVKLVKNKDRGIYNTTTIDDGGGDTVEASMANKKQKKKKKKEEGMTLEEVVESVDKSELVQTADR